jgi:hypothetical protein
MIAPQYATLTHDTESSAYVSHQKNGSICQDQDWRASSRN